MKKLILVLACLLPLFVGAQCVQKGNFSISVSGEGGYYNTSLSTVFFGLNVTAKDTAAAVFVPITVEYMLTDRFAIGLMYKSGRYLEDNDDETNQTSAFAVTASYHFLVNDKNNLMGRMGLGNTLIDSQDSGTPKSELRASGPMFEIGLFYRHYFGEHFGLNFGADFNSYAFNLKKYSEDGVELDISDLSWELRAVGPEFTIGLCTKF